MQYTCCYFVMLGLTVGGMLGKLLWWIGHFGRFGTAL